MDNSPMFQLRYDGRNFEGFSSGFRVVILKPLFMEYKSPFLSL